MVNWIEMFLRTPAYPPTPPRDHGHFGLFHDRIYPIFHIRTVLDLCNLSNHLSLGRHGRQNWCDLYHRLIRCNQSWVVLVPHRLLPVKHLVAQTIPQSFSGLVSVLVLAISWRQLVSVPFPDADLPRDVALVVLLPPHPNHHDRLLHAHFAEADGQIVALYPVVRVPFVPDQAFPVLVQPHDSKPFVCHLPGDDAAAAVVVAVDLAVVALAVVVPAFAVPVAVALAVAVLAVAVLAAAVLAAAVLAVVVLVVAVAAVVAVVGVAAVVVATGVGMVAVDLYPA